MTKTTDWEKELKNIVSRSKSESATYQYKQLHNLVLSVKADARREVHPTINGFCCACDYDIEIMKHDREFDVESLKKTCSYCGVINGENIKTHKGIDGHTYYHVGYNQAIDDVLSTLKKEETP